MVCWKNSNLIKISIADSGRDKRTPVLLAAGNATTANGTFLGDQSNTREVETAICV